MKRIILAVFMLSVVFTCHSQVLDSVRAVMSRIEKMQEDEARINRADTIAMYIKSLPYHAYSPENPLKYIKYVNCVNADAEFYSWSIPIKEGEIYYSVFKFPDGKSYLLQTRSGEKGDYPSYLFYDFLGFRNDGDQYFVLFGWTTLKKSDYKALFIVRFEEDGNISFRNPLFEVSGKKRESHILQYTKGLSVTLKSDKRGRRIVFDHLAPSEEMFEGLLSSYGPDGSFDAFILRGGKWIFETSVKL